MAPSISAGKDETITFLVPDIHDLQTGGNVYNRRVVEGIRPEVSVRVVPWGTGDDVRSDPDLPTTDAIVIDSLLAQHPASLRAVAEAQPRATTILMVHYLHCIDPHEADTEAATDERKALRIVDGAITTSCFTRRALVEEDLPADRVRVARPGLGEQYRGQRPARLNRGPPRMLTVANLLPAKGLDSFVDVLRGLRALPWTWTLVGNASLDPEYAERVHRRLRTAGLTGRVTWTGTVAPETLRTWYDRADLFVLPSRFETCSLSTREAMARGLPVVSYRVGGMAENFDGAAAGHLVPPGTPSALQAALRSLLRDPMTRGRKGDAAWRRSRAFPTWAKAAAQFREALGFLHVRAGG